jgi:hypothetical protein
MGETPGFYTLFLVLFVYIQWFIFLCEDGFNFNTVGKVNCI